VTVASFLADKDAPRVLLVDFDRFVESSSPQVVTSRHSSHAFLDRTNNRLYKETVVGEPFFKWSMSEAFSGSSLRNFGRIDFSNADEFFDSFINDSFGGRAITLRIGSPDWVVADFHTIFTGVIESAAFPDDETFSLVIRDQTALFDKTLQVDRITEEGDLTDKFVPLCYGAVKSIRPIRVPLGTSPQTYKWIIHDSAVTDVCVQLYDKGKPSTLVVTKNNADASFTLSAEPEGDLTVDAVGDSADQIGEIITDIATRVGATVNAASMSALTAAVPYDLGIYITNELTARRALDSLLPAGWRYHDNRDGELVAGLLADFGSPAGSVLTIDNLETRGDLLVTIHDESVTGEIAIGYDRNYTPTTSFDETAEEDRKEFLKEAYRTVEVSDASVALQYLLATPPPEQETYILSEADATTEANRLLTLFKVRRYTYDVECFLGPLQLNLGDVVTLKDNRFGLSAGVPCVVVGIQEFYLDNLVRLVLWR